MTFHQVTLWLMMDTKFCFVSWLCDVWLMNWLKLDSTCSFTTFTPLSSCCYPHSIKAFFGKNSRFFTFSEVCASLQVFVWTFMWPTKFTSEDYNLVTHKLHVATHKLNFGTATVSVASRGYEIFINVVPSSGMGMDNNNNILIAAQTLLYRNFQKR